MCSIQVQSNLQLLKMFRRLLNSSGFRSSCSLALFAAKMPCCIQRYYDSKKGNTESTNRKRIYSRPTGAALVMLMARICDRFECPSSCRLPLPMDRIWRGKVDQDHVAMSQSSSHCQYARRYSSNENCQRYCGFHGPCLVLQYSAPDSFTPNECVKFTNETGVQWY